MVFCGRSLAASDAATPSRRGLPRLLGVAKVTVAPLLVELLEYCVVKRQSAIADTDAGERCAPLATDIPGFTDELAEATA